MSSNSLFSQLDLGKRSLSAHQTGMGVAGHNIANIDNENFSRQRVQLTPQHPRDGRYGTGVDISAVSRVTDRFLNHRLIGEQSRGAGLSLRQEGLRRLEGLLNDAEGQGLRGPLNEFWDAWGNLANQPESEIYRKGVISAANALSQRFRTVAAEIQNVRQEFNGRIALRVDKINELAKQLVSQNALIQQTERGTGETNDLRDQREGTLKELSQLISIEWLEDDNHLVNVSIGDGWPLVLGRRANRLEASHDSRELGMFTLKGIDAEGLAQDLTKKIRGGELMELIRLRDETSVNFSEKVDRLAAELAFKINRVHATGTGINATFDLLKSSFALRDDAMDKPVPFLSDGIFRVRTLDTEDNFLDTYEVEVNAGRDTLPDIVNRINRVVGDPSVFEAILNADGSVTLASKNPTRFVLGDDDTKFSVVMGFNNFFENLEGAKDLRVNQRLVDNPTHISTGHDLLPGDNSRALEIHQLQFLPNMEGDSITFDEFYNGVIAELGLLINRNNTERQNQDIVVDQFQRLRDEVSAVNMDEEVADMVQSQRAFDASAKFLSTVDEMTRTVINM